MCAALPVLTEGLVTVFGVAALPPCLSLACLSTQTIGGHGGCSDGVAAPSVDATTALQLQQLFAHAKSLDAKQDLLTALLRHVIVTVARQLSTPKVLLSTTVNHSAMQARCCTGRCAWRGGGVCRQRTVGLTTWVGFAAGHRNGNQGQGLLPGGGDDRDRLAAR